MRYGHVVAIATVGEVVLNTSTCEGWRVPGEWGIELLNVYKLPTPIPLKGGQGWRRLMTADCLAWEELQRQLQEYSP